MALVVTAESLVLLTLVVLVAGLLRSHAEILRILHDNGLGTAEHGDRSAAGPEAAPVAVQSVVPRPPSGPLRSGAGSRTFEVVGVTPSGEAIAVGVQGRPILLAFLSSGCGSCAGFWTRLSEGGGAELEPFRVVVVTMGPARESESALRALQSRETTVVMSSEAWDDYDVPGSPYFLALDHGEVRGEGTAARWDQLISLMGQAQADSGVEPTSASGRSTLGREERADADLAAAGIFPGDPRLHPHGGDGTGGR
jgi:hypothetical protein